METAAKSSKNPAPRQINFPAFTSDYRLVNGKRGLGLVANRNIKKGTLVFSDSYEFMFADVQDGDILRFDNHERANRRCEDGEVPATFVLTREILTRTHGVPALTPNDDKDSAGTISWFLEVPGMLINHSCDPNIKDDSHDFARGEAYAARDIKRGDELFYDYTFQEYDHGPSFECLCGSANCRGKMMGFKRLSEEEKQKVLPFVSPAVKAMHEADLGTGLPVKKQQSTFPPRSIPEDDTALRLVVPGPSYAEAPVLLKPSEEDGSYGLYATKEFQPGELVYEFWTQLWPANGTIPIDMTFSTQLLEGDPDEGTVIRVNALEYAKRDRKGRYQFSGWDLFTKHSCNPAIVYTDRIEDEDDDWRGAYAARSIQKGELLTADFNTILWDRTDWEGLGDGLCTCGAPICRGTRKGFRFLSEEAQNELKSLNWLRQPPPYKGSKKRVLPGEALTPHVRVSWRARVCSVDGAHALKSSSSSESSTCSTSDEED